MRSHTHPDRLGHHKQGMTMATARRTTLTFWWLCCVGISMAQPTTIPALDQENLPTTNFSCKGKVIGGYYADVFTGCQMFHVCTLDENGEIKDYKFGCLMGTVFDQETRVCEREDEVDCGQSESFFHLNNELYGPGIIPSTADTAATSSAATVQVLDPTVALLGVPEPSLLPTDTVDTPSSSALTSQSQSPPQPPQPVSVPTSSPQPLVIPPGVTASTTRMSTSTSSSVTAAYSFPPLPFTISRTSTSVSASSRVHIQTPLAQISLHQGVDPKVLPAPHLRPSLLRLAAQAQSAAAEEAKAFEDLNPTSPPPVTSQTPADFEDVPRLSTFLETHTSSIPPTNGNNSESSSVHRQKRQSTHLTSRGQSSFQRTRTSSFLNRNTEASLTDSVSTSLSSNNDRAQTATLSGSTGRTTSRGRKRFRPHNSRDTPVRQLADTTPRSSAAPFRRRQNVAQTESSGRLRQRVRGQQTRDDLGSPGNKVVHIKKQERPITEAPITISVGSGHLVTDQATSGPRISRPRGQGTAISRRRQPQSNSAVQIPFESVDNASDLPQEPDIPTPIPPTVLTVELPPDSDIKVFDGVEAATSTTSSVTSSTDATTTTTTTTTTIPPFVFPVTSFSCLDKIPGGLYADVETGCEVFHICSVGPDSSVKDDKFVCGPGTLFDQKSRTCQTASEVDCERSPSLYYLNEPLKGPVFVELAPQLPEQLFDFPRIPTSPSLDPITSSLRSRRDAGNPVDLCEVRPIGVPLADITTGCHDYTVCENLAENRVVERRLSCKKGYLFSQLRRQCVSAKKVDCAKETLGEILGLGHRAGNETFGRKRRASTLLLSHRFRRAALPPLANLVLMPGVEDGRVRRALYSLAALQQWARENAHQTTFIEVYSLNTPTKDSSYSKKVHDKAVAPLSNRGALHRYGYISRRKRDANATVAEQEFDNGTKVEEFISKPATAESVSTRPDFETGNENISEVTLVTTSPIALTTIETKTIGLRTSTRTKSTASSAVLLETPNVSSVVLSETPTAFSTVFLETPTESSTVLLETSVESKEFPEPTSVTPVPISTALSTLTVSGAPTSFTVNGTPTSQTATVTPAPVTVTITTTKTIISTTTSEMQTILPSAATTTAVTATTTATTPLPLITSEPTEVVNTASSVHPNTDISTTSSTIESNVNVANSSDVLTQEPIKINQTESLPLAANNSNASQNVTKDGSKPEPAVTGISKSEQSITESTTSKPKLTENTVSEQTDKTNIDSKASDNATEETVSGNQTISEVETSMNLTTPVPIANGNATLSTVPGIVKDEKSSEDNATTTTESITEVVFPAGSVNISTTVEPQNLDGTTNASTPLPTAAPTTPPGPFTRETLPETNFTCKDKKLEQFYPDPEANCQVFHYCSPGFLKQQVLDLKFLCTGATMFDVTTQKCEDMANVTCGQDVLSYNGTDVTPESTAPNSTESTLFLNATSESVAGDGQAENTTEAVTPLTSTETVKPDNTTETLLQMNVTEQVETLNTTEAFWNSTHTSSKSPLVNASVETTTFVSEINHAGNSTENWNDTVSPSHFTTEEIEVKNVTAPSAHQKHNWNASSINPTTSEDFSDNVISTTTESVTETQTTPKIISDEIVEGFHSTEIPVTAVVSEMADVVTELEFTTEVTDRSAREEISTVTEDPNLIPTTENTVSEDFEISTELGPFALREISEEPKPLTDLPVTQKVVSIKMEDSSHVASNNFTGISTEQSFNVSDTTPLPMLPKTPVQSNKTHSDTTL